MLLVHGDCLEEIEKVKSRTVRLILWDPPYGTTFAKWDKSLDWPALWPELWRVLVPDGAILIFSAQPFTTQLIASQIKYFRYCWYWNKSRPTGFLNIATQPLRDIEEVCVFYKRLGYYAPQMELKEKPTRSSGSGTTSTLIKTTVGTKTKKRPSRLVTHSHPRQLIEWESERSPWRSWNIPTQKPVGLLRYLIRTYSEPEDIVFDPTMGSGSAGFAAAMEHRRFIGFEKDQTHFEIAYDRLVDSVYREPDPIWDWVP